MSEVGGEVPRIEVVEVPAARVSNLTMAKARAQYEAAAKWLTEGGLERLREAEREAETRLLCGDGEPSGLRGILSTVSTAQTEPVDVDAAISGMIDAIWDGA